MKNQHLSHLNQGENPSLALPLSQLTLSQISLILGLHVIASKIFKSVSLQVKSPLLRTKVTPRPFTTGTHM
jgi:hypothetical protein